jgi:hypothetical protein
MPDDELITDDELDDDAPIADDRDDEQLMQSVRAGSEVSERDDDSDESIGPNDPDKLTNAGEM